MVTGTGYWYWLLVPWVHGNLTGITVLAKERRKKKGCCVSSAYVKGRSRASVKVGNSVSVE